MKFSEVLEELKADDGTWAGRAGWNGKGMHIQLVTDGEFDSGGYRLEPFIVMYTADGKWVPSLASQTDILAEDWETV